jgi:hypothetical protein
MISQGLQAFAEELGLYNSTVIDEDIGRLSHAES